MYAFLTYLIISLSFYGITVIVLSINMFIKKTKKTKDIVFYLSTGLIAIYVAVNLIIKYY